VYPWKSDEAHPPVQDFNRGRHSADHHLHAYYPDEAFKEKLAIPGVQWPGSDSCYTFRGNGGGKGISRRLKLCACDPCLDDRWFSCHSNALDKGLWYGYTDGPKWLPTTKEAPPADQRNTRSVKDPLTAMRKWKVFTVPGNMRDINRVVAVRIHEAERSSTTKQYYLAMVREAPYQLQQACVIHGNPYEKGWWVFAMTWFHKLPEKQIYYLGSNPVDKLLFNLNAVVTGIGNVRFTRKTVPDVGPTTYELSEAEHSRILNDGNLGS
jgi:hypothetical protein